MKLKIIITVLAAALATSCGFSPERPPEPTGSMEPINSPATERMLAHDAGWLAVKGKPAETGPVEADTFVHDGVEFRMKLAERMRQWNRPVPPDSEALLPGQELVPRTISVPFGYNDTTFMPTPEQQYRLRQLLAVADRVEVRGRTDGLGSAAGDEMIARERAIAAKRYLLDRGVPASIIAVNYVSNGDFIADNESLEGRRSNRRVDIEFFVDDFTTAGDES